MELDIKRGVNKLINTLVVLDFETTGLDHTKDQVTEIGAVKLDKDLNEVGSFHTFVRLKDGNELSTFTDITLEQLDTGITEHLAMKLLYDFIGESIVVAQWAPFDLAYLDNFTINPKRFICTKSLTAQSEPTESSSLGDTCARLGISLENAHRAMDDVRATIEVLKVRLNEDNLEVFNTVVTTPGRPLTFIPKYTELIMDKDSNIILDNRKRDA